jgi:hypothetical protein
MVASWDVGFPSVRRWPIQRQELSIPQRPQLTKGVQRKARLHGIGKQPASHRIHHPKWHDDLQGVGELHNHAVAGDTPEASNDGHFLAKERMVAITDPHRERFMSSMGIAHGTVSLLIFWSAESIYELFRSFWGTRTFQRP